MADYAPLHLFIAGEWIGADGRDTMPVINPADESVIGALPLANAADLDRAVAAAAEGFRLWSRTAPLERSAVLRRAAMLLRERIEALAPVLTLEQGKPLAQSRAELNASADFLDWYAEEGRRAYGRSIPPRSAANILCVFHEPVGPVAAFAPWNFPASQMMRKLAPALAAGCSVVVKPSEETPATALALARILDEAGLPKGVLNVVFGVPAAVAERLIRAEAIRKISFTGSTAVGKQIARLAADGLKRVTLELGGHAPVIIFDDADIERAAQLSAVAKLRNAGQACIAPTRFLVQDSVHDRFAAMLGAALELAADELGPMANERRIEAMHALTADALEQGGRLVCGGRRPMRPGFFWTPTLIADAPIEARAMREEPFGPLALTRRFHTDEEAFAEANRLPYGLASYVFTASRGRAAKARREIDSGLIGVNGYGITWPETPFGGVKESGYGSEGGSEGLEAYLSVKFVSETLVG